MDKNQTDGDSIVPTEPYLRLAKHFENAAETYREVRLHGPATDAEARKGACEFLAARSELEDAHGKVP